MRQIPRLCLPQVPLRALFEAPIMVIWETEIACQDFITTIRPILLRWDNVGWRGCPSLLIFIKCLCCKWLVLRIRVEILESSSFKWQRWRKAMAGQAWLLQGPSGLGPVCLLAILWPPLDHAPVKQTFSEKDSEPLKTVSFPGASEVPLDPVFCAREVHTEAFLHAIHQVLDDTHTLPLGSYSLPKVFKKTKIYPKNWAPAALFFPPPTTPPKVLGGLPKEVSSAVSSQVGVSRNLLDQLHVLRPQAPQVQHIESINILLPLPTKFLSCFLPHRR